MNSAECLYHRLPLKKTNKPYKRLGSLTPSRFLQKRFSNVPEREGEAIYTYSPQDRCKRKAELPLLPEAENGAAFCRFRLKNAEAAAGVYAWVVDGEGCPVYIGEARNLKTGFHSGYGIISPRNCYKGGQKTNCKMNTVVLALSQEGKTVHLYFYKTADYKNVELALIRHYHPINNEKNNEQK